MHIDTQVHRAGSLAFLPLVLWLCGFILISFARETEKVKLRKIMLWALPLFLFQVTWAVYIMAILSRHPP